MALQNLTMCWRDGCGGVGWQVSGEGSQLVLPALTNIVDLGCGSLGVLAQAGGQVVLTNVVVAGPIQVTADGVSNPSGNPSVVDLARLARMSGTRLTASGGGQLLAPSLVTLPSASLNLGAGGVLVLPPITGMTNVALAVSGGAVLELPGLRVYHRDGCGGVNWQASGEGSQLVLPALTNIVDLGCGSLGVLAQAGGQVVLTNTRSIDGPVRVVASGTASVSGTPSLIDLSRLAMVGGPHGEASFTEQSGGIILLPSSPVYTVVVSAAPSSRAAVYGAGKYFTGPVTVSAVANEGYTFVNWTEGGSEVSTSAIYSFVVNANRTLVANVLPVSPHIEPPSLSHGTVLLSVLTALGPNYTLDYKHTLTDLVWLSAQTLPGTGGVITFTNDPGTNATRFYRIRVQ